MYFCIKLTYVNIAVKFLNSVQFFNVAQHTSDTGRDIIDRFLGHVLHGARHRPHDKLSVGRQVSPGSGYSKTLNTRDRDGPGLIFII
jgi:hypothetical protein